MTSERFTERSPRVIARIAGVFYAVVFGLGIFSLIVRGRVGLTAAMIAGGFYIAVTVLFYFIFKPVSRNLSLLAAVISLAGILIGPLGQFLPFLRISPLVFFGCYCLLIAFLILKSSFLPRFLGALLIFAGLGWLTFISPSIATPLAPYIFLPGIIGEGALTLWLVIFGVDEERWRQQAGLN
jgi:uncharacterized protein DUF4386